MNNLSRIFIICLLATFCAETQASDVVSADSAAPPTKPMVISYRQSMTLADTEKHYFAELIHLIFRRTEPEFGPYTTVKIPFNSNPREILAMHQAKPENLITVLTFDPRYINSELISPILIPYNFGISGYRVCFVSPHKKAQAAKVRSLKDLQRFVFGHGINWADTIVMRNAGLQVVESGNYRGLYEMLASGRIDLLCRAISEWRRDIERFGKEISLELDQHLLITYNLPKFIYVRTRDTQLNQRIHLGLKRVLESGELFELWKHHYLDELIESNIHSRLRIHLDNPLIETLDPSYTQYNLDMFSVAEKALNGQLH